ncbi:hypothetical protein ACHAQA_004675 [Verticillium albo-atrum]
MHDTPSNLASAAAVVYRSPETLSCTVPKWEHRAFGITGHSNNCKVVELVAIEQALHVAVREWDALSYGNDAGLVDGEQGFAAGLAPFGKVRVFSDCQAALLWLVHGHSKKNALAVEVRGRIDNLVNELGGRGVEVEMNWTPAHAGVPGNAEADLVAGVARGKKLGQTVSVAGGLKVWEVQVELAYEEEVAHKAKERRIRSL